jgi:hypothetical protein
MLKMLFWTAAIVAVATVIARRSAIGREVVDRVSKAVVDRVSEYIPA